MGRAISLLFLGLIALVAVALISCLSAEEDQIRAMPRSAWVFVILVFPVAGAVAWFLAGRPVAAGGGAYLADADSGYAPGLLGSLPQRSRRRTVAPDDNPDFLRSLDVELAKRAELAKRDRELFRRWEDDLTRRDDDQKRGTSGASGPDDIP